MLLLARVHLFQVLSTSRLKKSRKSLKLFLFEMYFCGVEFIILIAREYISLLSVISDSWRKGILAFQL